MPSIKKRNFIEDIINSLPGAQLIPMWSTRSISAILRLLIPSFLSLINCLNSMMLILVPAIVKVFLTMIITSWNSGTMATGIVPKIITIPIFKFITLNSGTISPESLALHHRKKWHNGDRIIQRIRSIDWMERQTGKH